MLGVAAMNFRGSSEPQVVPLGDEAMVDAVEELAVELESFAFERERVLAKLDIRTAAHARRTARELRLVATRIPVSVDVSAREDGFAKLGELLGRAHTLLEGERFEVPGRPAEGDPPMPSSRDAKTTPPPISDVRETPMSQREMGRSELELDYDELPVTAAGDANVDLPAILFGMHPNHRPTAQAMPAVSAAEVAAAIATPPRDLLPYLGADEGENDFDDETVARKVAWERSGNRVLGR